MSGSFRFGRSLEAQPSTDLKARMQKSQAIRGALFVARIKLFTAPTWKVDVNVRTLTESIDGLP
jgi:hypothetical protein